MLYYIKRELKETVQTVNGIDIDKCMVLSGWKTTAKHFKNGDTVIVADVRTLGMRFEDAVKNLQFLSGKGVRIYCVSERMTIETVLPQSLETAADIFLKIYKSLLSIKNKNIQANLLKQGRTRGAPQTGVSRIATQREKIVSLLSDGKNVTQIAKILQCSRTSLYRYIQKENLGEKNA